MKTLLFTIALLFASFFNDASTTVTDGHIYPKPPDNYGIKKTLKSPQAQIETKANGYICSLCSQVVSATKDLIIDHEAEIDEVLEQVCYKLFNRHPSEAAACEALIKQELPYIVSLIKKGVQPTQICTNLALC
uniref:Saposin B-type domain-containing protein n=1 Tax=Parascaris univalens TaxID=6257 RepID=A0A914ZJE7_PARUN